MKVAERLIDLPGRPETVVSDSRDFKSIQTPKGMKPVARTPFGDHFFQDAKTNKILFRDHETNKMLPAAASMSEFKQKQYDDPLEKMRADLQKRASAKDIEELADHYVDGSYDLYEKLTPGWDGGYWENDVKVLSEALDKRMNPKLKKSLGEFRKAKRKSDLDAQIREKLLPDYEIKEPSSLKVYAPLIGAGVGAGVGAKFGGGYKAGLAGALVGGLLGIGPSVMHMSNEQKKFFNAGNRAFQERTGRQYEQSEKETWNAYDNVLNQL